MAYSTASVSAAEQTAMAADKILLLTRNVLRSRNADPHWYTGGGVLADATNYDAVFAADGYADIPTQPLVQSPTVSVYELLFDVTETLRGTVNTIDGILVAGHNFATLARAYGATLTVTASIADNAAHSSNAVTLAQWTVTSAYVDQRLVDLSFGAFARYSNVRYFKLRISSTVAFSSTMPQVGEIFLGRRRQLGRKPDRPWDPKSVYSTVVRQRSKTRSLSTYEYAPGEADLRATLSSYDGTDGATGLDDVATLRAWHIDTGGGVDPFVWVTDPTSSPAVAHLVSLDPPAQRFNFEDINVGQIEIALAEHPPFVAPELY